MCKKTLKITRAAVLSLMTVTLGSCGGGGGGSSPAPGTTTPPVTVGSSSSTSGSTAVYSIDGVTTAITPGSGGGGSTGAQVSLVSFPNSGNAVGVTVTTSVTVSKIDTSLSDIGGTSVDPAHDLGIAYSYADSKVSFFKLSTKSEITTFDTGVTNQLQFSGGSATVSGAVMDPRRQEVILGTYDGFNIIDYSNPSSPTLVRNVPSVINKGGTPNTGGVEVSENFGYDPAVPVAGTNHALIVTGGADTADGDSNNNALELVDVATGNIYVPDTATQALFTITWYIDQFAVDTNYHVAVLADEGTGTTFVDLSKLTLGTTADANGYYTYSLPASAVSRITDFFEYDNLGIESTTHLVFMGAGYGGTSFVVGKLSDPATALGFSAYTKTPVNMPTDTDDQGNTVYWYGSYDPHGGCAYLTASDYPAYGAATALALWASGDGSHAAVMNMQHVLDHYADAGYDPSTTTPKDVAYFYLP